MQNRIKLSLGTRMTAGSTTYVPYKYKRETIFVSEKRNAAVAPDPPPRTAVRETTRCTETPI